MDDELNALSVELTFSIFKSVWDKYVPKAELAPGDAVCVVNNGTEIFSGRVETVTLDGNVTAYDYGFYLNKSVVILQCADVAAQDAIRQLCGKAGVVPGEITSLPTRIKQLWVNETPASILDEILQACTRDTGQQYRYYVREKRLCVDVLPTEPITAYYKPASNVAAFNIT